MDNRERTADGALSNARVEEILTTLNASGAGLESLDVWAAASCIKPDRVIEGPDITYARLSGQAEGGGPVVLVYFEGNWERATNSAAPTKHDREQETRTRRAESLARPTVRVPKALRSSRI